MRRQIAFWKCSVCARAKQHQLFADTFWDLDSYQADLVFSEDVSWRANFREHPISKMPREK